MTDHSLPSVPLSDSSLAEAVALTSLAFHGTPSYTEMVTDPERRRGFLAWLFERNVWLKLGSGTARGVYERKAGSGGGGGGGGRGAGGGGGGGGGGEEEEEEEEEEELVMFFMLERPGAAQITAWDMLRVCHRGLEPQASRPQTGLLLTRVSLALDRRASSWASSCTASAP